MKHRTISTLALAAALLSLVGRPAQAELLPHTPISRALPMEDALSVIAALPKDIPLLPAPEHAFSHPLPGPGPTIEAAQRLGWKAWLACAAVGTVVGHVTVNPVTGVLVAMVCYEIASPPPAYLIDTAGGSGDWLDPDSGVGDSFTYGDVYYASDTDEYITEAYSLTRLGHYNEDGTYVGPEPEGSTCLREPCDESGTLD